MVARNLASNTCIRAAAVRARGAPRDTRRRGLVGHDAFVTGCIRMLLIVP
jgi:hypothetical protein